MKEFNSGTRWHGQLFSKLFFSPGRERVKGYSVAPEEFLASLALISHSPRDSIPKTSQA